MINVDSTGIGTAIGTITGNAGKGNKDDKFRVFNNKNADVTTFKQFFTVKMDQFTENMQRAANNQSNGQSNGQGNGRP